MKMKMNRCGSSGSSGSDNVVFLLPDDIMVSILVCLPPRYLLRLKLVCKSWRDLISHPDFIQMHLDHSITNKNPLLLISGPSGDNFIAERHVLYSLNYNYNDDDDDDGVRLVQFPHSTTMDLSRTFLGSCNGLLLLQMENRGLYVWNPCNREYDYVSSDPFKFVPPDQFLRLEPPKDDYSYQTIAFGFFLGPVPSRRRLVETQVLVHPLGLTWEAIGTVPFEVSPSPDHAGVFLNGGIHWIATTGCGRGMIICIDIACEEYREIPKPESVSIGRDDTEYADGNVKLIVLKGLLCITNFVTNGNENENENSYSHSIEVWMMKDYYYYKDEESASSSWSKLCTIKQPIMALQHPGLKYFQPLSDICSKNGDEIVVEVKYDEWRSLVWYNMKNDQTRTIWKNTWEDGFLFLQVRTCIESLVRLHRYYNMYRTEELMQKEAEEKELQRIMRPWKKQKKKMW